MRPRADIIVVGGGVIGLTTAYFLAREGARIVLCDQGKTGMEASWAGAGILPPSDWAHAVEPFDRLRALSGRLFPDLSLELKERTGIDNGFLRCGGLEFLSNASEADAKEWYGLGIKHDLLSEREVRNLEPALAPHLGQAIWVRDMAQLRNPRHLQALRAACLLTEKVTIIEDSPAHSFLVEKNRVKEVHTESEILQADAVLLATGAWTEHLLQPLGLGLKIQPVRGQIALLNSQTILFQHILLWGSQYLVARSDGRVLVGSTEEQVGFEKKTTAEGIQALLSLGLKLIPSLAGAEVEKTWAGLRPGSPDGLPFLGVVPGVENLYLAAGHFRAGIQLSPGTAQLLKEVILGQPLSMDMDAFRLNR